MKKQKIRERITLATIVLTTIAFAALIALFPRLRNIETISSGDIDQILYERLDHYNEAIRGMPGLADIILAAENNPDHLTEVDRQVYLGYQRKFFDSWETAWAYNNAGSFDADRWNAWNFWFVNETKRRPKFGWLENRHYYSGTFLLHVDNSLSE